MIKRMCFKNDKRCVGEHNQIKTNNCRGKQILIFCKMIGYYSS
jgi:hypothetical protein